MKQIFRSMAIFLILFCGSAVNAEQDKPNFVFFLVDDLGWTDIAALGSSFYETPNVDRLVAEGMTFKSGYAACPVCSPTRASIMTGKYPARMGITDYIGAPQPARWNRNTPLLPAPYVDRLSHDETTLAEALKEGGYATFFAGKWHLGPQGWWPENHGFDVNKGGIDRGGPYGGKRYFSPYGNPRLEDGPDGEHLPDRLATEAIKFIKHHQDEPFLAYVSFYSVHTPLISREDLRQKYLEKKKTLPQDQQIWGEEPPRKVRLVQEHAVYAGMVEAMDMAVGKVLDSLDEQGLADNTIIFFMSDNGGLSTSEGHPTSNRPLRAGKGWMYEGGIREPMIIKWPGVTKAGSKCHVPVTSTDFYPTMLEMAGLPLRPKQHIDGVSLVELLDGTVDENGLQEFASPTDPQLVSKELSAIAKRPLFWHYPHYGNQGGTPSTAIRLGDWKLIHFHQDHRLELYNLKDDIGEKKNIAGDEPEKVRELYEKLLTWRKGVRARMPSISPRYKP